MNKETWSDIIKEAYAHEELDWIASDTEGKVGVFSAIMDALIPPKIGKSYKLYSELRTKINELTEKCLAIRVTPNGGNFSDWDEYSRKGLYSFDYQDVHRSEEEKLNQYDLINKPSSPIYIGELELTTEIKSIIPIINCDFEDGDIPNVKIKTPHNNLEPQDKIIGID